MRLAIRLHRYLGIAVGLVVSLWCMSAFVMMYVQYPEFTDYERVIALEPLDLSGCCSAALSEIARPSSPLVGRTMSAAVPPDGGSDDLRSWTKPIGLFPGSMERFRIEMMAGRPVLRVFGPWGQRVIDLQQGRALHGFSAQDAEAVSNDFVRQMKIDGVATALGSISQDQWTVYASYNPHRPLYHFAANDAAGTEWYVSGQSGEIVQITTARERFWNWIGSVTHWIYFTSLRQHTALWSQTIIWLTIISTFLTVLGIYVGIKRFKRRRNGRLSPYRGWMLWHHYTGLVFGALVLTWLVSGFFSMNPFGMLEGRSFADERDRLRGGIVDAADILGSVHTVSSQALPEGVVRIDSSIIRGEVSLIAWERDGTRRRLGAASLSPQPLDDASFSELSNTLRPDAEVSEQGWLREDDAYYYSHHSEIELPVYRVRYADGELFYLDAVTGELAYAADVVRQRYRWLFEALHRGDFSKLFRSRPVWDLFMLPLLLGVTLGALTGTWLGFRRLTR